MQKALRAYGEVLRLVRRLPQDSRGYYAKYARENFVNYRDVDPNDGLAVEELLKRTYTHSLWVLDKYSVNESVAGKLRRSALFDRSRLLLAKCSLLFPNGVLVFFNTGQRILMVMGHLAFVWN